MWAGSRLTPFWIFLLTVIASLLGLFPRATAQLPECSLAKTNKSCALFIDRANPVAPPTIQMYSGESITVVVQNPKGFERYFLDYQSGAATLKPEVASSIVQGLLPSLQKVAEFKAQARGLRTTKPPTPDMCLAIANKAVPKPGKEMDDTVELADICLGQLAENAIDIYQKLESYVAPDSLTPIGTARVNNPCQLQDCIDALLNSEIPFSTKIAIIAKDTALNATTNATYETDAQGIAKLTAKQKSADAIASDLQGYKQRLMDLPVSADLAKWGFQNCANFIKMPKSASGAGAQCIAIVSRADTAGIYHDMVTRTVTYALNTYNLVSNPQEASPDPSKKKSLTTITLNFAETPKAANSALRWEASAGAFFSSLPIRSFSVAPVFTNGVITDKIISQNLLYPTVVPFAAANYRLTNDLGWTRWKSNFYWTGAVGINPNTVSADFATGLSFSWRALMVSGLCHFGHDVRLTQGLTVGQSLGAGFSGSVPTETRWTTNFALGLSVRVPSIMGR
jgi:hypothetical protein